MLNVDKNELGTMGAASVVAIASFMPWATVTSPFGRMNVSGMDGDGRITLVLAIVMGAMPMAHRLGMVVSALAAVAVLVTCYVDISNVNHAARKAAELSGAVKGSVGYGLWIAAVAAVVAVISASSGSVLLLRRGPVRGPRNGLPQLSKRDRASRCMVETVEEG